jgi:hypothetical protein
MTPGIVAIYYSGIDLISKGMAKAGIIRELGAVL